MSASSLDGPAAPEEVTAPEGHPASLASRHLPIRFISKVIPGFGRGSKDLGIPTANLSKAATCALTFESIPCGIYWGYARIGEKDDDASEEKGGLGTVYVAAVSIGFNPTYGNEEKTVEPHLIAPSDHPRRHKSSCGETLFGDFYGETIRLSVVDFLRPELPFEGLEKLTLAIKKDIIDAERLGNSDDKVALGEKSWVKSNNNDVMLKGRTNRAE